jgi:hypothetical protein
MTASRSSPELHWLNTVDRQRTIEFEEATTRQGHRSDAAHGGTCTGHTEIPLNQMTR